MASYSKLEDLIRWGTIVSVKPDNTARVKFDDLDDLVSYDLRILVPNANKTKFQMVPDVGCQALCLMLPTGDADGCILGVFYNEQISAPISSLDQVLYYQFEDGTVIEYDKGKHKLTANVKGDADITADKTITADAKEKATVKAPDIELNGNVKIKGTLDVIIAGVTVAAIGGGKLSITGAIDSTNSITIKGGDLSVTGNITATGTVSGSNL